jgi:hypothetical protein
MTNDRARYDSPRTLPADRAFVVHFAATPGPGRRLTGRVEHLASGTFTLFASLRGLLAFFAQRLEAPDERRAR